MPRTTVTATWSRRLFAGLLLLVGATLATGGGVLATAGGSLYYLLTGIAVVVSAVLVWRSDRRGAWVFGFMLAATLAWAIGEVGFVPWQLVPRLVAPFVLALGFLLPGVP